MRFRSRSALLAVAVSAGLAAPSRVATAAPTSELTGTYRLVSIDNVPGSATHGTYRHLLVSGRRTYVLRLPAGQQPTPGSTLRVRGVLRGTDLAVTGLQSAQPTHVHADGHHHSHVTDSVSTPPVAFANGSTGTTRVLVILARWNTTASSVTQTSAADVVFQQDHDWFNEASYGQLGLTGHVTPWLTIGAPSGVACGAGMTSIEDGAKAAALAAGYDASGYDRTMIFFPKVTDAECTGVAGWAYIGGNTSWLNGVLDRRISVHEQGHNYGLLHAHAYTCTADGVPVSMSATCLSKDYGNPFDAMGSASYTGHFSAPYKNELGWLDGRQLELQPGESVRLGPFEAVGVLPVAASVVDGTATYWVEYRRRIGVDADLPISATTGAALIHAVDPAVDDGAGLLDMTPDGNHLAAELPSGASWLSPGGVLLSVSAADETGITVTNHGPPGDRASTVIASTASPTTVTYPAAVTATARLTSGGAPLAGRALALYTRARGGTTWRYLRTVLTSDTGYATTTTSPLAHTDYQWRFAGDAEYTAALSVVRSVSVRIKLIAKFNRTSMPAGYTAKLYGSIGPAHSGHTVYLQRYYSGAWRTVASFKLGSSTAFTAYIKISVRGTYNYRYYVKSHTDHYGATTPKATLKVY